MDGKPSRRTAAPAFALLLLFVGIGLFPRAARAAHVEISGLVSYSNSDFGNGYSSLERRYSGTIDFKFTAVSAIEFEYTQSHSQYSSPSYLNGILTNPIRMVVSYDDTVYSVNWVQNLAGSKWIIQPYVVIGGGKLDRHYTQAYPEVPYSQTMTQNVFTGTGGVGLRLFLTKNMALKSEAKTYVPNFQFSKWKQDEAVSFGLSWSF